MKISTVSTRLILILLLYVVVPSNDDNPYDFSARKFIDTPVTGKHRPGYLKVGKEEYTALHGF